MELCEWNGVVLERSLVRNQESGVTQIRWRVEGGVLDSLGLDSMAAGVKCLGGSSPSKLFTWYDYDVIDIVNWLWLVLSFQAQDVDMNIIIIVYILL